MLGIGVFDIFVLILYLLGITGLGFWTRRKIKSSGDFFMGNRGFGRVMMIAQAFGAGTHTDQPVSVAGAAYTSGIAGIWYQWMWLFSTPFYWIIAPIYRRLRYVTMADFFKNRYGNSLAVLYTLVGVLYFCMIIGTMLKGTGVTIAGLTGHAIPEPLTIIGATVLFVIYGLAGGLVAAVITDLVQGILILVLSFLLLPFAWRAAGGISAVHEGLPEHMFNLVAPQEMTLFFISMIIISGLVSVVVQPHHMAIGGSGKTEIACRSGWTYGNFLKRFATIGWVFIGVFAAFLYPGLGFQERELVFGLAAKNLLPVGFVGLMIAAMLAAVMSTCDAFMVHGAALFTRNVYLPFVRPKATDRSLMVVARVSSVLIVIAGVFFAFLFPSVVSGLMTVLRFTSYLGISFWLGVMWRRANRYGAWASTVSMLAVTLYTGQILHWPLPNQIALYLPVGLLIMIIVSLLTRSEPEEKLHEFYTLLDTPVGQEQRLRDASIPIMLAGASEVKGSGSRDTGCSKRSLLFRLFPQHSTVEDGLILVDLLHLRGRFSWARYRTDILGFIIAFTVVFLLVLLLVFLAQWGA